MAAFKYDLAHFIRVKEMRGKCVSQPCRKPVAHVIFPFEGRGLPALLPSDPFPPVYPSPLTDPPFPGKGANGHLCFFEQPFNGSRQIERLKFAFYVEVGFDVFQNFVCVIGNEKEALVDWRNGVVAFHGIQEIEQFAMELLP